MELTPTTELDAVNVILSNMGEAPINTLEGQIPLDATKARGTLNEVSLAIQSRGWHWNKEMVRLSKNSLGEIPTPSNALSVETELSTSIVDPMTLHIRDGKLYRIQEFNNGFTWDDDIDGLDVRITFALKFEYLPESARRYITVRAARIHQVRELGNETLARNDSAEEVQAMIQMRQEEAQNGRYTLKRNRDIQRVINRNIFPGAFHR